MQRRLTLIAVAACLAAGAGGAALASDQPPPKPGKPEKPNPHKPDKPNPHKPDKPGQPDQGAKRAEKALFGVLLGRNEIGQGGSRGAGDPDGRGSATAVIDGTKLCFGLTARDIGEPVAAHIHRGNRNENGDIVVPLTQPSAGDPGASSGCVDVKPPELAQELVKTPHKFYWNIHTKDFPAGAIRGQVFAKRN